jgi:hypothetical protein
MEHLLLCMKMVLLKLIVSAIHTSDPLKVEKNFFPTTGYPRSYHGLEPGGASKIGMNSSMSPQ